MITPTMPLKEHARMQALKELNILDTLSEEEFDSIVDLAASICNVPISLVSLVDEDRQWFKAKKGLEATETPRDIAFCAHAINEPDAIFEVENALNDIRFEDNPLVSGDPNIRFYAGSPLVTSDGHALGTLCVIDQKPRKLTEEQRLSLNILSKQVSILLEKRKAILSYSRQLEHNVELAEAEIKMKSEFMSNVSHEIRTPLNAIIGSINLLELEEPGIIENEKFKLLKFGSANLLSLINDVLDYQKIESGKLEIELQDFDLMDLLTNLIESWKPIASEKQVGIFFKHDKGLNSYYEGDKPRIGQIINNLISNALKFTNEGMVALRLTKENDQLRFEVQDTGIGIPEEKLAKIFESFEQVHSKDTEDAGGTGLGLSISQKLVRLMGGEIQVKSELGFGSIFSFVLPLKEVKSKNPEEVISIQPQTFNTALNVLLVEDNPGNKVIASGFLKKWGLTVDTVSDGLEAVEKVRNMNYDMVLMDLRMPKMSGFEATQEIRKLEGDYFRKVPIIAMTASMVGEVMDEINQAGMNGYISKPFDPNELQMKIAEITEAKLLLDQDQSDGNVVFDYLHEWFEGNIDDIKQVAEASIATIEDELARCEEVGFSEECLKSVCHNIKPNLFHLDLGHLYDEIPEPDVKDFDCLFSQSIQKINKGLEEAKNKLKEL